MIPYAGSGCCNDTEKRNKASSILFFLFIVNSRFLSDVNFIVFIILDVYD